MGKAHGLKAVWDGLNAVDEYATQFPDIIDYYLHGGRDRVKEAYEQVAAFFGVDAQAEPLTVPTVSDKVQKALGVLDHDPHYRYRLSFGDGEPPELEGRERSRAAVMAYFRADPESGKWVVVDVIARCAASAIVRPITIQGSIAVAADSDFRQHFDDFLTYGTGFVTPDGAATFELDAPGGLGGTYSGGVLITRPLDSGEDEALLRAEVLAPNQEVLATV